jgi:hypothetical protein
LGLIDLTRFGIALQLRWEWHRKLQAARPWVPLPAPQNSTISAVFSAATDVELGDGNTAVFWLDRWIPGGRSVREVAPSLLRNVTRARLGCTVAQAINDHAWVRHIAEPYTVPVLVDYLRLWRIVNDTQLNPDVADVVLWRWSANMSYSSSSAYHMLFAGSPRPLGANARSSRK